MSFVFFSYIVRTTMLLHPLTEWFIPKLNYLKENNQAFYSSTISRSFAKSFLGGVSKLLKKPISGFFRKFCWVNGWINGRWIDGRK